jgi:hypothetical protein
MTLYALTVRQPWAAAITHGQKRVENRFWNTYHRGPIAIHAGAAIDSYDRDKGAGAVARVAELSGMTVEEVWEHSQLRGAVVAVADLPDVCSESFRIGYSSPKRCGCDKWAFTQQRHFLLAGNVQVLPDPVPCKGHQRLWSLPDHVEAAVRDQLSLGRAA